MDLRKDTLGKAVKAANAYDKMTDIQREAIAPYAERIFKLQEDINKLAKNVGAGKVCHECKGACCTDGIEIDIDTEELLYVMFAITQKQREKIYSVIMTPNEDINCSFVGENGCVLPNIARPINCKVFHCMMIPYSVEIMNRFGGLMIEAESNFRLILDIMEIEL